MRFLPLLALTLAVTGCAGVVALPVAAPLSQVVAEEEPLALSVIKAQHMIATCNAQADSAECYALQIGYYTGRAQTPLTLFERVRDSATECAMRCVADLGLHAFGWTRADALARTKLDESTIDAMLAWPGEALACLDSQAKNEKNPQSGD